jgi:hypothetical protein
MRRGVGTYFIDPQPLEVLDPRTAPMTTQSAP